MADALDPGPPGPRLAPGRVLGSYRVDALLHRGAHLEVYAATAGDEEVVLKVPVDRTLPDAEIERFRAEAQATALVRHPHVVRIREAGVEDGLPFLVTDRVVGPTLAARLRSEGAFALDEAVDLLLPLLSALVALRTANVPHGELKAGNVALSAGDLGPHPWCLDVGIAKRDPVDDRRRDVRAVGSLFHALLAGEERAQAWAPDDLARALERYGVPLAIATTLAGATAPPWIGPPASARACGRALAPLASAEVRARWTHDFVAPPPTRGEERSLPSRNARRALALLVVLALMAFGVWSIRDRIHLSALTPLGDRLLMKPRP